MIRLAVKELRTRKVYVSSNMIADHLRRYYPIESDPGALKRELDDKLEDAVSVGLVTKCGEDAYCLPNLRQQATTRKTDLTRFWERYNNRWYDRRVGRTENRRKKIGKSVQRDGSDRSVNEDRQNLNETRARERRSRTERRQRSQSPS